MSTEKKQPAQVPRDDTIYTIRPRGQRTHAVELSSDAAYVAVSLARQWQTSAAEATRAALLAVNHLDNIRRAHKQPPTKEDPKPEQLQTIINRVLPKRRP
jgi:hypothetical protein